MVYGLVACCAFQRTHEGIDGILAERDDLVFSGAAQVAVYRFAYEGSEARPTPRSAIAQLLICLLGKPEVCGSISHHGDITISLPEISVKRGSVEEP